MKILFSRPRSLVAALILVLSACYERSPMTPQDNLARTVPQGSIQLFVQQESADGGGQYTFVVRVVSNGVKMGAYQGEVTFQPGALELVGVETPKTGDADFHIVNAANFASGRIKFAAYTTAESFGGTEALRLKVKTSRSIADAQLAGKLDVAGETTGASVSKTKLLASRGIVDAVTSRVIVP
jgi:hypothetical protein